MHAKKLAKRLANCIELEDNTEANKKQLVLIFELMLGRGASVLLSLEGPPGCGKSVFINSLASNLKGYLQGINKTVKIKDEHVHRIHVKEKSGYALSISALTFKIIRAKKAPAIPGFNAEKHKLKHEK